MIIKELDLKGVYEIQLESVSDKRGNFTRVFDNKIFIEHSLPTTWVQENHSYSRYINTIRGLHFQFPPYSETKLVRCIRGEIYDVFLDLRKDSETFGKWDCVILSQNNNKMILIPKGFAHGYCTLTDDCEVTYKVDNYYNPQKESGIRYNDVDLDIPFPFIMGNKCNIIISNKDSKLQSIKEFIKTYGSLNINSEKCLIYRYGDVEICNQKMG